MDTNRRHLNISASRHKTRTSYKNARSMARHVHCEWLSHSRRVCSNNVENSYSATCQLTRVTQVLDSWMPCMHGIVPFRFR